MKLKIALIVLVGILATIGQAIYTPKPPNCEPANAIHAIATSQNNVFAKASLSGNEMYKLDWDTFQWAELPLDTSLHFVTNPQEWSFLDDHRVVKMDPISPYLVEIGGQDLNFCIPK